MIDFTLEAVGIAFAASALILIGVVVVAFWLYVADAIAMTFFRRVK